jgi:hypothetical protein
VDALLAGLAPDGGLYVPSRWPHFSPADILSLRGRSFQVWPRRGREEGGGGLQKNKFQKFGKVNKKTIFFWYFCIIKYGLINIGKTKAIFGILHLEKL